MAETAQAAAAAASAAPRLARPGMALFLVGFVVLFLELAAIRWFGAYVVFLQFFSNVILLASFLGMSCGCLAARGRHQWLEDFPTIALGAALLAILMLAAYRHWSGIAIDVGGQRAGPQEVFFGTEYRNPDVATFVVPIDLVAAFFFVVVAAMFLGLGQVLGQAFDVYPDRVGAYTLNIAGSLAGIVAFSALAFARTPPLVWFAVVCAGVAYLLRERGRLNGQRALFMAGLLVVMGLPLLPLGEAYETHWSPYDAVNFAKSNGDIMVNTIGHQRIAPFEQKGFSVYPVVHLLNRGSGAPPYGDVAIIGAGSGNDVANALRFGAKHVDAVEIDPVIQEIGIANHPDHPYQDPRVTRIIDDGRHYLRTTDARYDLVIFGLVDSLILHSGYANLRLESYLFTEEAFADVKRVLKPGGSFVMYNYLRQGWIVERAAAMIEHVWGCPPLVISLPYRDTLKADDHAGFTMLIAGCQSPIAAVFKTHPTFWMSRVPDDNLSVNGFTVTPAAGTVWDRVAPTTIVHDDGAIALTTDDWPFPYLHARIIPDLEIRMMVILGVIGVAMVWWFLPKRAPAFNGRMFFLGAAFMLLETRAVVQMALLFGSTWLTNSLVFFAVLVLILAANLRVSRPPEATIRLHYIGLFVMLAAAVAVPLDYFLAGDVLWRTVLPCVLALGPMYFAGVVFARSFKDAGDADYAFGSNIAGSVVGGLSEAFASVLGFRYLLLLAMAFYALSIVAPTLGRRRATL